MARLPTRHPGFGSLPNSALRRIAGRAPRALSQMTADCRTWTSDPVWGAVEFAQVNLNCAGAVDFITKIKRFLCLPLRTRKPSPDSSARGRGARSLAPSPVAPPSGRTSAVRRVCHLLHLPVLPRREPARGLGIQADLAASPAGRGCKNPNHCPFRRASKGARSLSLGTLEEYACSALLPTARRLSLRTRAAASFLHAVWNGGRVILRTETN